MEVAPLLVVQGVVPTRAEMRGVTGVWSHLNRWNGLASLVLLAGFLSLLPAILSAPPPFQALALLGLPAIALFAFLRSHGVKAWQDAVLASPPYSPPPRWLFTDDGVQVGNDFQSTSLSWHSVTLIDEPDRLVLATAPNVLWVLPRRVLTAQQATTLNEIIATAVSRGVLRVDSTSLASDNRPS